MHKFTIKHLFALPFAVLFSISAFSQIIPADKNVLLPPNKNLVAVHHPDLKDVEEDVREQIVSFQKALAKAANAKPANAGKLGDSYGTMGQIYHAYSFFDSAEECFTNSSRLTPKDFRWVYLLGKIAAERNKIYEAIDLFKKARVLKADYMPIYVNLGNAYLELDLLSIAKQSFENALKLQKNNPAALYGLGQISYSERKYAEAADLFEKVLSLVPDANRVHYSLALAFRGMKDLEKANFHLSKQGTVGVRPADPVFDVLNDLKRGARLRLLRGKLAIEAGRFAEAEVELRKVLAIEPENVVALVNYGVALVQMKRYPEAVVFFEKAVVVSPENVNARYNLAVIFSLQKNHFQAIPHLKAILQIDPKDISARFLLAKQLRDADLLIEAHQEFLIVNQSNPDNEEVLLEGVKLLTKKGDHELAKGLLEKSLARFPDRNSTVATLAFLLATSPKIDLRDGKKALELSQKIYISTKRIDYGLIVALSYAELGQCDEAAKLTRELLEQATKAKDQVAIMKLNGELKRYENEKPCRAK